MRMQSSDIDGEKSRQSMAMRRLTLGLLQMAAAAFSSALLIWTGINRFSVLAALITTLLTSLSVWLIGSRSTNILASRRKERNPL